jgi:hypothetical protein
MKKIYLSLITLLSAISFSQAQWTTSGSNIYNSNSGNVGIGTTSPGLKLETYGTAGAPATSGTTQTGILRLNQGSYYNVLDFGSYYTAPYGLWIQGTGSNNLADTYPIILQPNGGNVGIGTTGPLSKLSVGGVGNSRAAIYGLANGTASVYDIGGYFTGTSYGVIGSITSGNAVYGEATTGNGAYFTSSSGYGLIVANGNVGIGTTSPSYKLDVANNFRVGAQGGSDYTLINGGAGYGARVSLFYADGTENSRLMGNNDSWLNLSYGNLGIGTTDTHGYKFAVNGSAIATSMTVQLYANWPDYVFKKDYRLPGLADVKAYIDQNHRLPEMPSEQEIAKNGLNLGEMNKLLTKKVEELTLYLIEKDNKDKEQSAQLKSQQDQINRLQEQLDRLLKTSGK